MELVNIPWSAASSYQQRKQIVRFTIAAILAIAIVFSMFTAAKADSEAKTKYYDFVADVANELDSPMTDKIETIFFASDTYTAAAQSARNAGSQLEAAQNSIGNGTDETETLNKVRSLSAQQARYERQAAEAAAWAGFLDFEAGGSGSSNSHNTNPTTGATGAGASGVSANLIGIAAAKVLRILGLLYALVLCFVALFKDLQRGDANEDVWFRFVLHFVIACLLILHFMYIVKAIQELGLLVIRLIKENVYGSSASPVADKIMSWADIGDTDKPKSIHILKPSSIGAMIEWCTKTWSKRIILFAVWVFTRLPIVTADIILYSIIIEIAIRIAFMPLALADIAGNGARSAGVQYIKKFFALFIRIAMCYIIAMVASFMIARFMANVSWDGYSVIRTLTPIIAVFAVYMCASRLYAQTSNLASQVVGA